ncbi:MAG: helix-turn-helix transcriptional regulator [Ignavibacteriaceae bacterium]|jgi:DNA-binding Xre family transcriptional regulator
MLKYNLNKIFKMRGVHNPVQFLESKGYKRDTAYRIVNNIAKTLQLRQIQDICLWFNCTPNDLFEWTPDKQEELTTTPALMQLMPAKLADFAQLAKDIPMHKVPEFMKKIEELKKGM